MLHCQEKGSQPGQKTSQELKGLKKSKTSALKYLSNIRTVPQFSNNFVVFKQDIQ